MFSVKGGFSGQDRQVYRMPVAPVFIGRESEKSARSRAPPARRIVHYRTINFVTPAVRIAGNSHTECIKVWPTALA
jgi:hypothetical protein